MHIGTEWRIKKHIPHAHARGNYGDEMNGNEFREALKAIDWKQSDFARAMGVHRNSVSDWCSDVGQPPIWAQRYVQLLAKLKALSLEYIEPPPKDGNENTAA